MKENNTKEGLEKNKNSKKMRKKVKRQISIFTVMLWIFLISTMIWVTVNSTKKTNALEVEDENWNIQLVMYDRSSDMPEQAITEFTWNAVNSSETKQLCMQINYACTTNKGYQPGEIEITIPGIAKDNFSEYWRNTTEYSDRLNTYEYWLKNNVVIAADKTSDTTKKYDWSYSYDLENNEYIFINNMVIAENEHFEGTVQIVYNLRPQFKMQTDLEYKAKIKENIENIEELIAMESNICNFHYTSKNIKYSLLKNATAAPRIDYTKIENILNDYYWVRYNFASGTDKAEIIKKMEDYIKEELPEGCVMYDYRLNKVNPIQDNVYYIEDAYCHIGYPKDIYNEGDRITNIAELWGRYEDEEQMQKLSEASCTVSLVDFDFEYKGELYNIDKGNSSKGYVSAIKNSSARYIWNLSSSVFYTDSIMDVEIGDDLLYITRENGEVTKLNDDEYNFTHIAIPVFYTYNKYTGTQGDKLIGYDYEVQVRYKDTDEYVVIKEGITNDKFETIEFDGDDIVGLKVVIKDLDKTLYKSSTSAGSNIIIYTDIHTKDCKAGKVYNFDYLKVYKKDENGNKTLANVVNKESYKTPSRLKIAEYDIEKYGVYMQRAYGYGIIANGNFDLFQSKKASIINNAVNEEKYEVEYNLESNLIIEAYEVNKDCIVKAYDILPIGMNLASDEK